MLIRGSAVVAALVACLFAPQVLAQKVSQPWTAPRGAHESRIQTCTNPIPLPGWKVAMDDWICPQSGAMTRAQWWGVVSTPAQLQRRFYIAIYTGTAAACLPANRVYFACVNASSKPMGLDCDNRIVYRFSASLPAPYFVQTQGQHYWFQVSEDDSASVTLNAEDFRWSSHLPISPAPLCPAVQRDAGGVYTQPILDDCPNPIPTDLAWNLYGTTIVGVIPFLPPSSIFLAHLLNSQGQVMETFVLDPDSDGSFQLEPDSAPGHYRLQIVGMSFFDIFVELDLMPNTENHVQVPMPCFSSDFDRNGDVGTDADIASFFEVLGGMCR